MNVTIFGRGKVGRSLARALRAAGADVTLRAGRGQARGPLAARQVLILAVPDAQIRALAERLAPRLPARSVVLHCAGAHGPELLAACRARGAAVAGFHPLVSFPSARALAPLQGALIVVDGDPRALRSARRLCGLLGASCCAQPILGPAYHAAAALLANGSVALAFAATRILRQLGMPARPAERAAASLLHSVAANVQTLGLPAALSGPVARGDAAALTAHAAALTALTPPLADSYLTMQPLILACARAQGLPPAQARSIARALARARRAQRHR